MMASDFFVTPVSNKQIEHEAIKLRSQLDLMDAKNIDIVRLLEFDIENLINGFKLIIRDDAEMLVNGHFEEAYCEFHPPRIVVSNHIYENAALGDAHARMILAHELGHLMLHSGYNRSKAHSMMSNSYENDLGNNLRKNGAESQAKRFAAYFLMPKHIVQKMKSPEEISKILGVSLYSAKIRFESHEVSRKRTLSASMRDALNKFKQSNGFPKI